MTDTSSGTNEEQALDTALEEATPLLAKSLQRAEQARRRNRRLILGGLVMLLAVASLIVVSALTNEAPQKPGSPQNQIEAVAMSEEVAAQGWRLWNEQKYRAAELVFINSIELDTTNPNAHNGLGWSLLNLGRNVEAQPHFEKTIGLEPQHIGAINGLAICRKNAGDVDGAIELWLKMHEIATGPHAGTFGLARTYMERGEYAEAIPLLEMLAGSHPGNAEVQQMLRKAQAGG